MFSNSDLCESKAHALFLCHNFPLGYSIIFCIAYTANKNTLQLRFGHNEILMTLTLLIT